MKSLKIAQKGLNYSFLGVFLLSFLAPCAQAMEQANPGLMTPTLCIAPEIDEVTDDETRIYLPEPAKFACAYQGCTYTAATKSNLNSHVNTVHSKLKRFKCVYPDCKYSAYYKSQIRAHAKSKHRFEN